MNRSKIAQAIAALAEPLYVGVHNQMAQRGLLLRAMFERLHVRELVRTDDAGPLVVSNIPIGSVAYGALGTNAVHVAGTTYISEIFLPRSMTITGIGVLNGATVGTDKLIAALYNRNGIRSANSALAGVLSAGADAFQELPLTTPYAAKDGRHWILVQCNGATAKTRRIAASTYLNRTTSAVGVFGTLPASFTPPATFTADVGPIAYVY